MTLKRLPCPGGTPTPPAVAPSATLAVDLHRRPLAASATDGGVSGMYSNDAGQNFADDVVDPGHAADPSLLVDTKGNRFLVIYSRTGTGSGTGLRRAAGSIEDGFPPELGAGGLAALSGVAGTFPACARAPEDLDYTLLIYLDGSALKAAASDRLGADWTVLSTIAAGVDLAKSGRAGVCFLGAAAFAAFGGKSGTVLMTSLDKGSNWTFAGLCPEAAHSGLSLAGWQGTLYLLGWSEAATPVPSLWRSGNLGETWEAMAALPDDLAAPSAIGVIPQSGQLRLGVTHHSDDDGATWVAN